MTAEKTVYVIEDEEDIGRLIKYNLALEGFRVQHFTSGEKGLEAVARDLPDLVLLDLMLPRMDGLEISRQLKLEKRTERIPLIMVTAKGGEEDIVMGLELGADDYITKPFSPKVLVARVKSVLRRHQPQSNARRDFVQVFDMSINPGKHEVMVGERQITLTPSEFQILLTLARKPGWVFTRSQIVDAIRGDNYAVTDRTVDFQMVGLRKKLEAASDYIETVRGIGYRFKEYL